MLRVADRLVPRVVALVEDERDHLRLPEREPTHLGEDPEGSEPPYMCFRVGGLVGCGAFPGLQETFPEVELDRGHRDAGDASEFGDPQDGPLSATNEMESITRCLRIAKLPISSRDAG